MVSYKLADNEKQETGPKSIQEILNLTLFLLSNHENFYRIVEPLK